MYRKLSVGCSGRPEDRGGGSIYFGVLLLASDEFNTDRAMIGTVHVGADERALDARAQGCADEEVIDAPADVPGADVGHRAPPGIMPAAFFKLAERVEETSLHERAEAGAFLWRKTMVLHIGLGMGEVDLGVRHVEVPAKDHRFALFELFEVTEEVAVPLLAVSKTGELALRVGHIDVHEEEVGKLGGE